MLWDMRCVLSILAVAESESNATCRHAMYWDSNVRLIAARAQQDAPCESVIGHALFCMAVLWTQHSIATALELVQPIVDVACAWTSATVGRCTILKEWMHAQRACCWVWLAHTLPCHPLTVWWCVSKCEQMVFIGFQDIWHILEIDCSRKQSNKHERMCVKQCKIILTTFYHLPITFSARGAFLIFLWGKQQTHYLNIYAFKLGLPIHPQKPIIFRDWE